MHDDMIEIRSGSQVFLMGHHPLLCYISRQHLKASYQHLPMSLVNDQAGMGRLRIYLSESGSAYSMVHMSDHDVLQHISKDIERGRVGLISLPRIAATQVHSGVPLRLPPPAATSTSGLVSEQPVSRWTPEQRASEVIRRAATKVPEASRQALLSLLSKDNIALIVGTFAFVGVANLTPYGLAADLFVLAVAYWYCGKAAIGALRDLTQCINKATSAQSSDDLDAASDALARAIVTLGVLGLIAVLHKIGEGNKGTVTAARPLTIVEQRMAIAQNFFRQSGMAEKDIEANMKSIDFEQPVEVVPVQAGTRLFRLEVPGDSQGSWYAERSTSTADQRGITSFGESGIERQADGQANIEWQEADFKGAPPAKVYPALKQKASVEYAVNSTTRMLKTSAAPIRDTFSAPIRGASVPTRGGAIQFFSRDKLNIR